MEKELAEICEMLVKNLEQAGLQDSFEILLEEDASYVSCQQNDATHRVDFAQVIQPLLDRKKLDYLDQIR